MNNNKPTGIWLDRDRAYIYHLQNGDVNFIVIESQVECYHITGGSGNATPYGPQEAISEKKFLERRKHQLREYFKKIALELTGSKEVLIMGPAETKFHLNDFLKQNPSRNYLVHDPITQERMTKNQMKSFIKSFYNQCSK